MFKKVNVKYSSVGFIEDRVYFDLDTEYGFTCFEGQDPYFSITGSLSGSDGSRYGGCLHEEILKHDPKVAPLVKWHLVSLVQGPMHYLANGMFWWKRSIMTEPEYKGDLTAFGDKAIENFKNTIVYGVTSMDYLAFQRREMVEPELIRTWLQFRFNELMQVFFNEMRQFKLIGI